MNRIDYLRTFTMVVEQQGISAAAQKLKLSKGTVSKQITSLEHSLGLDLLQRGKHTVSLTEAGHLFYRQCQSILTSVQEAEGVLSGWKQEPKGSLRVLAGRHFASQFITPFLFEFYQMFPEVILHLELDERIADLTAEGIDVMLGMSLSGPADCIQKRLLGTRYIYCASPDYLAKYGAIKKPGDLVGHHYITHSMRQPPDRLEFHTGQQVTVNPLFYFNDTEVMLQAALQGLGVVKLHQYVVAESLKKGSLVEILRAHNTQELSLYVCYRDQKYLSNAVRAFIRFVEQKVQQKGKQMK